MIDRQMELSLESGPVWGESPKRCRRHSRAREWFALMRQAVDQALNWQPAPEPPPEQTWLRVAHQYAQTRQIVPSEPTQICE